MRIAVGIATAGRPDLLRINLEELQRQTRPPERLVVCAPSAADISQLPAALAIECIVGPRGLTCQRNAILDRAEDCEVVVFFDDDFLPERSYLEVIDRLFRTNPDIVMATGNVVADGILGPGLGIGEARCLLALAEPIGRPIDELSPVDNGYGCNMAVRLAAATGAGCRFDERLPLYGWLEDVDFSRQLARIGRIVRVSAAYGVHLGVKRGRQSGKRLGYSQIANPIYLAGKGTCPWRRSLQLMSRNFAANLIRSLQPEPYIDRAGRLRGNCRAITDLIAGRLAPERILEF